MAFVAFSEPGPQSISVKVHNMVSNVQFSLNLEVKPEGSTVYLEHDHTIALGETVFMKLQVC